MKETFCSDCSDADIREEAYRLFQASGCAPGHDLENWLLAKRLVEARRVSISSRGQEDSLLRFPLNEKAICHDTPHPFSPQS
jgi:hypothetical protein